MSTILNSTFLKGFSIFSLLLLGYPRRSSAVFYNYIIINGQDLLTKSSADPDDGLYIYGCLMQYLRVWRAWWAWRPTPFSPSSAGTRRRATRSTPTWHSSLLSGFYIYFLYPKMMPRPPTFRDRESSKGYPSPAMKKARANYQLMALRVFRLMKDGGWGEFGWMKCLPYQTFNENTVFQIRMNTHYIEYQSVCPFVGIGSQIYMLRTKTLHNKPV